ncbi:MAG: cysteine--tRNA ligase [Xanthomonadales bacterium]|nr:cysteine--tRNA ligase [Xanthomonadales bacterium]
MQIHNSLTRQKEPFEPLNPEHVTIYVCGPTVYSYAHIGNARPAVVFDVLARLLRVLYKRVTFVRNITDIDDKINAAAAEAGVEIGVITSQYEQAYLDDLAALGVRPADRTPRVTEHVDDIIGAIRDLIRSDHAYEAEGHVLFDVSSYPEYGRLSGRDRREMIAGARVEIAPYKRDPADFVLWKPSTDEQPGWNSPWGRGRPGWHIECSAMASCHLGETIDIHAGGMDLQFPHHENEIAQSVCWHGGKEYARYWMHNGLLNLDGQKMAKSVGNVVRIRDVLAQVPGEVARYVLLSAHYRQPLDWTDDVLAQARSTLDRVYRALASLSDIEATDFEPTVEFMDALEDDLNTPRALAEVAELVRAANKAESDKDKGAIKGQLLACGELLGLFQTDPAAWFGAGEDGEADEIDALVAERQAARARKDYGEADRIRDQLTERGIVIEDSADGVRWRRTG